jgi:hypothetical protein
MFSESFKYFFAVTVLNLSSIGLALLAHIYSKYAICKSCENSRRHRSKIRTSPGKHRFRSRFIRTLRRGMVTGSGWTPTEIRTSEGVGRPWVLVPSFLFSTPQDGGLRPHMGSTPVHLHTHLRRCQLSCTYPASLQLATGSPTGHDSLRCEWLQSSWSAQRSVSGHLSASHPHAGRFDIYTVPDHGCDNTPSSSGYRSYQLANARSVVGRISR